MRRMRSKKRLTVHFILLLLSAAGILLIITTTLKQDSRLTDTASKPPAPSQPDSTNVPTATPTATPEPTPTPVPTPQFDEAVWMAVGDIMMHKPELPGAYDTKTKKYNFNYFFDEVKPILEKGDWVMANLETPVAGAAYGYTGYPSFNAPIELLDALQYAGFNILTNANNHSLDKGGKGLMLTLQHLKKYPFAIKGTAESQEEADTPVIVEHNGIKMGLLAYTYGTNGIPLPKGKPYAVSMIDEQKMINDIHHLKEIGADFVTVALHFGVEYQTSPNEEQKKLARKLVAEGADIIAGSHPHVIQPYEVLDTTDADGRTRQGLIIYSMGNFISAQRDDTKDYGVIFKVTVRKNKSDGSIELSDIESTPTYVHRYQPDNYYRFRILPVEQTIAAASDSLLTTDDYNSMKQTLKVLRNRLRAMLNTDSQ
ncbi:poly-gamma-glutamate synthesis protein (capsule biosynthesis protein) [Paenibacillus catalpae]|uniref:Poly-gamma-glutamate synthesis protein (Capsule biosynthesis protein) n=1 Tax=Paenibacillus catalpae TaxID=1045775 RepID=A0A1I2FNI9_9BACL|nr:CapA family protein [Paenibacillus catalpae]SFF07054.1 poly-gamma-glutamate synthesis protein (capsule biosynthesis protein) [Paenibacillus catalpae]